MKIVFDGNMLMTTLERLEHKVKSKIRPLALKKIKDHHVGRLKQYLEMLYKFMEVYERKKTEEADYKAKIREKIKKRPGLPASGSIMRFRKIHT